MILRFHDDARARFDEIALSLLDLVKRGGPPSREEAQASSEPAPPPGPHSQAGQFAPDLHIKAFIGGSQIIGTPRVGRVDHRGDQTAYMLRAGNEECWIEKDGYREVRKLAEKILRSGSTHEILSQKTVESTICDWIEAKVARGVNDGLTHFLENSAKSVVTGYEYWVPIHQLFIEQPFQFGRLFFGTISRETIDRWKAGLDQTNENYPKFAEYIERRVRPLQGHTYASMCLIVDPDRGQEVVLEEAEKTVSLLRIFSVAALHPEAVSACVPVGTAQQDSFFLMTLRGGSLLTSPEGLKGHPLTPVFISQATAAENWRLGARDLDRMLKARSLSKFEDLVLNACLIYARCTTAKAVPDKLTYILAALESVLIQNNTESIQSNLSERMAFALVREPEKRARIIRVVKDTYGLRSQYLHHGRSLADLELLQEFMEYAWHMMLGLVKTTRDCSSREELLAELERRKLS